MLKVKRVYDAPDPEDGVRFLVERLWPRGLKKEEVPMEAWLKDVAPSPELRRWFDHDPAKWKEFERRYRAELDARPEAWEPILEAARHGKATLLYSARDVEHNNAIELKTYIEKRLRRH